MRPFNGLMWFHVTLPRVRYYRNILMRTVTTMMIMVIMMINKHYQKKEEPLEAKIPF